MNDTIADEGESQRRGIRDLPTDTVAGEGQDTAGQDTSDGAGDNLEGADAGPETGPTTVAAAAQDERDAAASGADTAGEDSCVAPESDPPPDWLKDQSGGDDLSIPPVPTAGAAVVPGTEDLDESLRQYVISGTMTVNEARARKGLPPIEDAGSGEDIAPGLER